MLVTIGVRWAIIEVKARIAFLWAFFDFAFFFTLFIAFFYYAFSVAFHSSNSHSFTSFSTFFYFPFFFACFFPFLFTFFLRFFFTFFFAFFFMHTQVLMTVHLQHACKRNFCHRRWHRITYMYVIGLYTTHVKSQRLTYAFAKILTEIFQDFSKQRSFKSRRTSHRENRIKTRLGSSSLGGDGI